MRKKRRKNNEKFNDILGKVLLKKNNKLFYVCESYKFLEIGCEIN